MYDGTRLHASTRVRVLDQFIPDCAPSDVVTMFEKCSLQGGQDAPFEVEVLRIGSARCASLRGLFRAGGLSATPYRHEVVCLRADQLLTDCYDAEMMTKVMNTV